MRGGSERWQEKVRYAVDTGSIPVTRRRSSRLGRRLLVIFVAASVVMLALFAGHAIRGSAASVGVASASLVPEDTKKRAVTPKNSRKTARSNDEAAGTLTEPETGSPPVEPVGTGALPTPGLKLQAVATQARPEEGEELSGGEARSNQGLGVPQRAGPRALRQARRAVAAAKSADGTRSRAGAGEKVMPVAPLRRVASIATWDQPRRVAVTRTTVCLYFVLCF